MIRQRLKDLGIGLPEPRPPAFQYVPVAVHRGVAYVSGQLPWVGDRIEHAGKVDAEVTVERAREAARACALQGLSSLEQALGGLERVERVLKVTGFVASSPGFVLQPQVIDAASELLVELFGPAGRHARSAVGVAELPRRAPVEIELVVAVRPRSAPAQRPRRPVVVGAATAGRKGETP